MFQYSIRLGETETLKIVILLISCRISETFAGGIFGAFLDDLINFVQLAMGIVGQIGQNVPGSASAGKLKSLAAQLDEG